MMIDDYDDGDKEEEDNDGDDNVHDNHHDGDVYDDDHDGDEMIIMHFLFFLFIPINLLTLTTINTHLPSLVLRFHAT
jgi:ABC-type Zn2+ transport system substrate-binding protein/surface adhesin